MFPLLLLLFPSVIFGHYYCELQFYFKKADCLLSSASTHFWDISYISYIIKLYWWQNRPLVQRGEHSVNNSDLASTVEPELESEVEPEVEPEVESEVELQVESEVEPKVEWKVEPEVESEVEPDVEPKIEPEVESRDVEPKVEPQVESGDELEVGLELESQVQHKVEP